MSFFFPRFFLKKKSKKNHFQLLLSNLLRRLQVVVDALVDLLGRGHSVRERGGVLL